MTSSLYPLIPMPAVLATLVLVSMMGVATASSAQTPDSANSDKPLSCATLKQTIEDRLQSKGVKNYKLDIVDVADSGSGKVVGHCDGGKHKITYAKDSDSEAGH